MFLKLFLAVLVVLLFIVSVYGYNITIIQSYEDEKFNTIRNIIDYSGNRKGWINFHAVGKFPDSFFKSMQGISMTFLVANVESYTIDENLQYRVNTLVINCDDFVDFETKINIARNQPSWHPHANTIVYHNNFTESDETIARIFFGLWFYKVINAIIVQFNDNTQSWMVTYFNPYISEKYKLEYSYGCWTRRKLAFPFKTLQEGITCTNECHNVTLHSKLRADFLGTCIGFQKTSILNNDTEKIKKLKLFEDKARNLHGFALRAYTTEVLPFFMIDDNENGTYTIRGRDGFIWNTMAETMNFTIDLSPSVKTMKNTFDFELSIQQIFDYSNRKADLSLLPVYQFDLVIIDVDLSVAFKDSGLCFLSHRAGFETALFNVKSFQSHYKILIEFLFCFLGIWFVFFIFNMVEKDTSYDQAGKDLVNAIRTILSISLYKPPKKESFKIFLLASIWSFFIMNFATQAAIISFFSAFKRGKDVETFEDVIEKGYMIEGMASPDVVLPETEEKYRKINAKLVPIRDLFGCVKDISNDSRRFCLIDCSVGRYLERNRLNEKGEQYLHIAKDQVHNNYLNMIFQKHSPLTDEFNRKMLLFLQAGLINKWEQYRFTDIRGDAPIKSLAMGDLIGIFKCYVLMVGLSTVIFIIEVSQGALHQVKHFFKKNWYKSNTTRRS